jgi:hypothetical protein
LTDDFGPVIRALVERKDIRHRVNHKSVEEVVVDTVLVNTGNPYFRFAPDSIHDFDRVQLRSGIYARDFLIYRSMVQDCTEEQLLSQIMNLCEVFKRGIRDSVQASGEQ